MHFEKLQDEDADTEKLSVYTPAEIRWMKDELKDNKAKARIVRFELERKRRFRDVEEAKQRKKVEDLTNEVLNLEKIRHNLETSANGRRRDKDMREIGELLLKLNYVESLEAAAKTRTATEVERLKDQDHQLREVEKQFRHAPGDVNQVALKKHQTIESRYFAIQRRHDKLKKAAQDAQEGVQTGMIERQAFHGAYTRIERQYNQNSDVLKNILAEITKLNEKRNEFLKKAAQNQATSNSTNDQVVAKLRNAEHFANVERETRILSVQRAVDRTPYWRNESISEAIHSFWLKPPHVTNTMQKTIHLEETLATISRIMNVDSMNDVIKLYEKREENNKLLTERLKDLNEEAERLVQKIEGHYKALKKSDEIATAWENTMEKKITMLLNRTREAEENYRNCNESLQAFREFYDKLGNRMTEVYSTFSNLIPHSEDIKAPVDLCTGENYREYQMAFAKVAHYFHAIFDYWKQEEHERKCRTDPLYTGVNDDDYPLALIDKKLLKRDFPVSEKLKLLPPELRFYNKRNQFENEDRTVGVMSAKSIEHFAHFQAEEFLIQQEEYLDRLDGIIDKPPTKKLPEQSPEPAVSKERGIAISPAPVCDESAVDECEPPGASSVEECELGNEEAIAPSDSSKMPDPLGVADADDEQAEPQSDQQAQAGKQRSPSKSKESLCSEEDCFLSQTQSDPDPIDQLVSPDIDRDDL